MQVVRRTYVARRNLCIKDECWRQTFKRQGRRRPRRRWTSTRGMEWWHQADVRAPSPALPQTWSVTRQRQPEKMQVWCEGEQFPSLGKHREIQASQ